MAAIRGLCAFIELTPLKMTRVTGGALDLLRPTGRIIDGVS